MVVRDDHVQHVLYCIVLYCIVLYCIVLYCIVLYLYCIGLDKCLLNIERSEENEGAWISPE